MVLTVELELVKGEVLLEMARPNLHCRQDTQCPAQEVHQVSPNVDHMMDIEFSYWTAPNLDFCDYLGNTFIALILTSLPRVLLPVEGLLPDEWIYFNDID